MTQPFCESKRLAREQKLKQKALRFPKRGCFTAGQKKKL